MNQSTTVTHQLNPPETGQAQQELEESGATRRVWPSPTPVTNVQIHELNKQRLSEDTCLE